MGAAGQGRDRSIRRNTAFALIAQIATAAFTAVLTFYLVRALGSQGYGVFALAVSFGALVVLPSDFGVSSSSARFIAERRGRPDAIAEILANALRLRLATTALVCVALAALAGPIASAYSIPELVWPLRAVALATFGQSVMWLYGNAFVALGRLPRYLRIVFGESAMETSATIVLVALWGGATAAAIGRAAGFLGGAVLALALCVRLLGRGVLRMRTADAAGRRSLIGYAGALFIVDSAFTLLGQVDVLLVGAFLGASAAGTYQAPIRLVTVLHYPGLAASLSIAPRMAAGEHGAPDSGAFRAGLRWLIVLQGVLVAPLLVWARPIVALLLGPGYGASADVLRALTPFVILSGLAPLVSTAVNYLGQARRRVPIAIATVAISIAANLVLIPRAGVVGAAVGADVAYAVYVPAHLWICARLLNLPLRPLLGSLLRSLLAAGAMALVLVAAGTTSLSLLEWVSGTLGGVLAYVAVLLISGEISGRELRALGRLFSRTLFRTDAIRRP
jgi:O-antigen/teichoic acid export membrane protein